MHLQRLAVFCGSSPGTAHTDLAYALGQTLAERGIGLVYGAGGAGLMGAVAQGALDGGGEVIGVIPTAMVAREWGKAGLTEFHEVESMHQRKAMMAERSDAFVALPGGLGTLEEIFEVWTWRTLGYHDKPVAFLDADGFWTPLLDSVIGLGGAGFIRPGVLDDLVVAPTVVTLLDQLEERVTPGRSALVPGT